MLCWGLLDVLSIAVALVVAVAFRRDEWALSGWGSYLIACFPGFPVSFLIPVRQLWRRLEER